MNYYCDECYKTIKTKSKHIHIESLTNIEFEKSIQLKNTTENPEFFDIYLKVYKVYKSYFTNHKKTDSYFSAVILT